MELRKSRPARGARIEILCACGDPGEVQRRAPQGARGLKCRDDPGERRAAEVAPRKGRED